jgi:hypothetical protein
MESAEGKIQEKGYTATFPILVNIADTPSYFISLKDDAGLVKSYSFVSVSNYQIVGVSDTIAGAEEEYRRLLKESGKLENNGEVQGENKTITSKIYAITTAVVNGNTKYYIMLEDSDKVFIADITHHDLLPFTTLGDTITLTYKEMGGQNIVESLDVTLSH